jgi:hypothetical protein
MGTLRRWGRPAILAIAMVAGSLVPIANASPIDARWSVAASGEWTVGANWSTDPSYPANGAPTTADVYNAVFDATGAKYTVTLSDDIAIAQLRLLSADATVAVAKGHVLTLGTGASVAAGSLTVAGTVVGGTISDAASFPPRVSAIRGGTFDGVTLASKAVLNDGALVKNGMTLSGGTLYVASLSFGGVTTGDQTWEGNGGVELAAENADFKPAAGTTLTIGPGVVVVPSTGRRQVSVGGSAGDFSTTILQGTLSADKLQSTVITRARLLNRGVIEARNGGVIDGNTTQLNYSNGTLTGGTWAVYANSTMRPLGSDAAKITTNNASVILSGPNSLFGSINFLATNLGTFTVRDGRNFTTAGGLTNGGTLIVGAGSMVTVAGTLTSNGGSVGGDGALVAAGATLTGSVIKPGAGVLRVNGDLSLADGAKLDLTGGQMVLDYSGGSPGQVVGGWIRSAFDPAAATHWGGPGIGSSVAAADAALAVGWGEAADLLGLSGAATRTWHGQTVDATSVLVALALAGDADLNGTVDTADLGRLAAHYQAAGDWAGGDFTADADVDFDDLQAWARNYHGPLPVPHVGGGPAGFDDQVAAAIAAVPEPGAVLGFVGAIMVTLRRRRVDGRRSTQASFTERD